MNPSQRERRGVLLDRNNAAMKRWPAQSPRLRIPSPQRTGQDFLSEMTAVAKELEALARELDSARGDPLERARTWRYVGNAYFDLANATDSRYLKRAIAAYRNADALLSGTGKIIEQKQLDYYFGHALFHLSAGTDLSLLRESQSRYASAARGENQPGGHFQIALENVSRIISEREGLSQSTHKRKPQGVARDANQSTAPVTDDDPQIGKLLEVYKKDVAAKKVSETRQMALDTVLTQLGSLIQSNPKDVQGLTIQISGMFDAAKSMLHLTETSQDASMLPAGSRAEAVWRRFAKLKLNLSEDLIRQINQREHGPETVFSGLKLLQLCAEAFTFLHAPGRNDDSVSAYETDVLRQRACEVRTFSLCNQLTLVSPVWSSSPLPQDPNAAFFSGSDLLRKSVSRVCAKKRLKLLLAEAGPKDFAANRWDQLRGCHIAVFDLTGYTKPDPDQETDFDLAARVAAVSYELGIALTLGRAVIVLAKHGQDLPFDVDIEPIRLKGDGRNDARISDAIDDAIYGVQRGGAASSIPAASAYIKESFSSVSKQLARPQAIIVETLLKMIDDDAVRDPVKFRRLVEPVLGSVWPSSPLAVYPAWPGSYPAPQSRRCFHVTAFGPAWAGKTMKIIAAACETANPRVEYVRGDQVMDPDIIRSIWNNLCQASHVIVDLTALNANVALELGIAHALGRNVLLLTQDGTDWARLRSTAKLRVHRYSITGTPGLNPLRHALDSFLAQESARKKGNA